MGFDGVASSAGFVLAEGLPDDTREVLVAVAAAAGAAIEAAETGEDEDEDDDDDDDDADDADDDEDDEAAGRARFVFADGVAAFALSGLVGVEAERDEGVTAGLDGVDFTPGLAASALLVDEVAAELVEVDVEVDVLELGFDDDDEDDDDKGEVFVGATGVLGFWGEGAVFVGVVGVTSFETVLSSVAEAGASVVFSPKHLLYNSSLALCCSFRALK